MEAKKRGGKMLIAITTSKDENGVPMLTKKSEAKIEAIENSMEKIELSNPVANDATKALEDCKAEKAETLNTVDDEKASGTVTVDNEANKTAVVDNVTVNEASIVDNRANKTGTADNASDEKTYSENAPNKPKTRKPRKTQTSKSKGENPDGITDMAQIAEKAETEENPIDKAISLMERLKVKPEKYRKDKSEGDNEEKGFQSVGEITQTMVANQLYHVYLRCMQEVPVTAKDKETGKQVPTGVYQFDVRSALKALELLGDAVGLFKPVQQEETKTQSYEEFLKSGGYDYEF